MHDFILNALLDMARTYPKDEIAKLVVVWGVRAELTDEDIREICRIVEESEYARLRA